MGTGLFLRRLYGTTHDTKDVSKTTDTQYSAVLLYPILLWIMLPACVHLRCNIDLALTNHFILAWLCSLQHQGQSDALHCIGLNLTSYQSKCDALKVILL